MFLEASHWRVGGLEVRYFGTDRRGLPASTCARLSDCWIEGNDVHTCAGRGIWLRVGAADNLVEQNLVHDPRVGGWPWERLQEP